MGDKVFKTKSGYCHILPDRIVLTRSGVIGNLSQTVVGNTIYRVLLLWTGISVFSLTMSVMYFLDGNQPVATMFFILSAFLMVSVLTSLNNSTVPVILRDSITSVEFTKGIPGVTRARFVITYKDEKGKELKRLIMLRGSILKNRDEIEQAQRIMREANLIS